MRLRSQGYQVYGIGKPSKAEALAKVCTEFVPIERGTALITFSPQKPASTSDPKPQEPIALPPPESFLPLASRLTELLIQATTTIMQNKQVEWVSLAHLGSYLHQLDPSFQAQTYGYSSLPTLVQQHTDLFEVRSHTDSRSKEKH